MAGQKLEHADARETQDSDVAASGVREGERETTPAPPNAGVDELAWGRTTEVPRYDVAAHAFESSLRHAPPPRLPHDVTVPRRTDLVAPPDLELRAAFVLLHVDGRSSVAQIAELTSLPVDEVLATFLGLTAIGLVSLSGE